MAKWRVHKLVKLNGNIPYDRWLAGITVQERAKVEAAFSLIENVATIPPEKVKKYNELYEIKIYGNKTALRPLAIKDGDNKLIVLIVGVTKKGKIPDHQYQAALRLAREYWNDNCSTTGYWETESDLETTR
jgi:hypothetical protein